MFRKLLWLVCLVSLAALVSWADAWDKKTTIKINEPIQVPGAVLQPGVTYVIKLVESQSDRHIVRIMNEAEDEVIATILAIPNYRLTPTGDSQFAFWETPAGNPRAMRAWFYPGDNFGQEFNYPQGMLPQIAKSAPVSPPVTTAQKQPEPAAPPLTVVEKPLQAQVYRPTPSAPPPVVAAAPTPEPAPEQVDRKEMPGTASPFPALGLAAFVAISAGLVLRYSTSAR